MNLKALCVIILIAVSSVKAQDIEPQLIPRPLTTEGPEIEVEEWPVLTMPVTSPTITNTETVVPTPDDDEMVSNKPTAAVPVIPSIPGRMPVGRSSTALCGITLRKGRPNYNWIYRDFVVPNICSYCCRDKGVEQCIDISAFFCRCF